MTTDDQDNIITDEKPSKENSRVKKPPVAQKKGSSGSFASKGLMLLGVLMILLSVDYWRMTASSLLSPLLGDAPVDHQIQEVLQGEMKTVQDQLLQNMTKLVDLEAKILREQELREIAFVEKQQQDARQLDEMTDHVLTLQSLRDELAAFEITLELLQQQVKQLPETTSLPVSPESAAMDAKTQESLVRLNVELATLSQKIQLLEGRQQDQAIDLAETRYWAKSRLAWGQVIRASRQKRTFITELVNFREFLQPSHREQIAESLAILDEFAGSGIGKRHNLMREMRRVSVTPQTYQIIATPDETSSKTEVAEETSWDSVTARVFEELQGLVKISRIPAAVEDGKIDQRDFATLVEDLRALVGQQPELQELLQQAENHQKFSKAIRDIHVWFGEHAWQEN